MSALVMVCKSDRVELLSDAVLYDPTTGTIGAIHSKLAPLPELNCVMSGRGPIPVMWITAYVAGLSSSTFDDVVANFDAIRDEAATYNNGDVSPEQWAQSDIGLIGWSESRDRPEAYMSLGNRVPEIALATGILSPCDVGVFAGGSVDVTNAFVDGVRESPDGFDAEIDGLAVMEMLRGEALPRGDAHDAHFGHCVGGYVELATVTRAGVTIRTIHEWPDKIGKPISPSRLKVGVLA
jgi:hypothetical protein